MLRMRMFASATALCCLLGVRLSASAAQVECDSVYCFTAGDFSGEEMTGICITALPEDGLGTFLLGRREIRPGDILTAGQLAQLTFQPIPRETDALAELVYLPVFADHVAPEEALAISIRGKEDKAPIAEDSAGETYKNLPLTGALKVSDPEAQPMTYALSRNPRRGTVTLGEDGSFTYTPKKNKVGVDSFTFTATDPAGNVSREATVTVTILKPTDAPEYTDTLGHDCRFAAEWMKHTGIFLAEQLDGNACFSPDKAVSRGEFVTMLVKALEIPTDPEATFTGYTDEIPTWLKPYVAAALRAGLTAGLPVEETFRTNDPITGGEAAVMLQNALDLGGIEQSVMADSSVCPDWAAQAISVLSGHGISLADAPLTRGHAAIALYEATRLAQDAPGALVLRAAQ